MTEEKTTLVLHVGTGKTGTSFIQETLAANQETLKSRGIYYPRAARGQDTGGHHKLLAALTSSHQWWMGRRVAAADLIAEVLAEIEAARPDVAILSQEGLIWLPPEKVHAIGVTFGQKFRVKVVVDLRRQDLFVDSALSQVVKAAGHYYDFQKFWRFDGTWFVPNYEAQIRKWAKTFGPASIVVRPYEKSQFLGETIMDDFFVRTLGDTVPVELSKTDKAKNDRLSRQSIEFIRLMNGFFSTDPTLVPQFIHPLAELEEEHGWKNHSVVQDETRKKIIDASRTQNRMIAELYNYALPDGQKALREELFCEEFQANGVPPFGGLTARDVKTLLSALEGKAPKLVTAIADRSVPDTLDTYDRHQLAMIKSLI